MQIGYVGLGKMGKNMVLRLLEKGHDVVVWNRSPEPRAEVAQAGAKVTETVEELVNRLQTPKTIWLMLPAGPVTDEIIQKIVPSLQAGDTIIDGANSFYKDTMRRAEMLKKENILFLDAGVSGGPQGARHGACLMVGGEKKDFEKYEKLFTDIAAPRAVAFFEGHGAGHFVKMVHNGIEYGMIQALGEGFTVLKSSSFDLDVEKVAHIYNQQSVIESRLVGWLESGYQHNGEDLKNISGSVAHSGEGQWTVDAAQELGISTPVIEAALQFRIDSTTQPTYTGKVVSVLRHEFGGHAVEEKKDVKK